MRSNQPQTIYLSDYRVPTFALSFSKKVRGSTVPLPFAEILSRMWPMHPLSWMVTAWCWNPLP